MLRWQVDRWEMMGDGSGRFGPQVREKISENCTFLDG